jgi:hypothetical protein
MVPRTPLPTLAWCIRPPTTLTPLPLSRKRERGSALPPPWVGEGRGWG